MVIESLIPIALEALSLIWDKQFLRWGVVLFGIALALEIINGLLDVAIYTLLVGATLFLASGIILMVW